MIEIWVWTKEEDVNNQLCCTLSGEHDLLACMVVNIVGWWTKHDWLVTCDISETVQLSPMEVEGTDGHIYNMCRQAVIRIVNAQLFSTINISPDYNGYRNYSSTSMEGLLYIPATPFSPYYNISAYSPRCPGKEFKLLVPYKTPHLPSIPYGLCPYSFVNYSLSSMNSSGTNTVFAARMSTDQPFSKDNLSFTVPFGNVVFNVQLETGKQCDISQYSSTNPFVQYPPTFTIQPSSCSSFDGSISLFNVSGFSDLKLYNDTSNQYTVNNTFNGFMSVRGGRDYMFEFRTWNCGVQRVPVTVPTTTPSIEITFTPVKSQMGYVQVNYMVRVGNTTMTTFTNTTFFQTFDDRNQTISPLSPSNSSIVILLNNRDYRVTWIDVNNTSNNYGCGQISQTFKTPRPVMPISFKLSRFPQSCSDGVVATVEGMDKSSVRPYGFVVSSNNTFLAYLGISYVLMPINSNDMPLLNFTVPTAKPVYEIIKSRQDCLGSISLNIVNYLEFKQPLQLVSSQTGSTTLLSSNGNFSILSPGNYSLISTIVGSSYTDCVKPVTTTIIIDPLEPFNSSQVSFTVDTAGYYDQFCPFNATSIKVTPQLENVTFSPTFIPTNTYFPNRRYTIPLKLGHCSNQNLTFVSPSFTAVPVGVVIAQSQNCTYGSPRGTIIRVYSYVNRTHTLYANNILVKESSPSHYNLTGMTGNISLSFVYDNACAYNTSISIPNIDQPYILIKPQQYHNSCNDLNGKITVPDYKRYTLLRGNGEDFEKGELEASGPVTIEYVSNCSSGTFNVFVQTDTVGMVYGMNVVRYPSCSSTLNDGVFQLSLNSTKGLLLATNVTFDKGNASFSYDYQYIYSLPPFQRIHVLAQANYCYFDFAVETATLSPQFNWTIAIEPLSSQSEDGVVLIDFSRQVFSLDSIKMVSGAPNSSLLFSPNHATLRSWVYGLALDRETVLEIGYNHYCKSYITIGFNKTTQPPEYKLVQPCGNMNWIIEFPNYNPYVYRIMVGPENIVPSWEGMVTIPILPSQNASIQIKWTHILTGYSSVIVVEPPAPMFAIYPYISKETCLGSCDASIIMGTNNSIYLLPTDSRQVLTSAPINRLTNGNYYYYESDLTNPYCNSQFILSVQSDEPTVTVYSDEGCSMLDGRINIESHSLKPLNLMIATNNSGNVYYGNSITGLPENTFQLNVSITQQFCRRAFPPTNVRVRVTNLNVITDTNVCEQMVVQPTGGSSNYVISIPESELAANNVSGYVFKKLRSKQYTVYIADADRGCKFQKDVTVMKCPDGYSIDNHSNRLLPSSSSSFLIILMTMLFIGLTTL
ncbi:hypothetical protein DFA_11971 [Cavenderia fasciculata]|uniref:Uncharacterized protein n=1 Tax=Cavenderia fasciculata TaxID=261658 RepID=F4QF48_CACFS|nr:uncharacterized protein DFA_11971 [Cavenderia fasciculata]EGG14202.1 hypothetical protein DFA_11971 [Cavenderia fasciculata]|eukprot:XP_004350910.1 hypothetical protein DFA_11971 [Cavenderia fasciculata]